MLQFAAYKKFCVNFYHEEDLGYVSLGVQQAESTFIKYCTEAGFPITSCQLTAANIFADTQELDEQLCDKLIAVEEASNASPEAAALIARSAEDGIFFPRPQIPQFDDLFSTKAPTPEPPMTPTPQPTNRISRAPEGGRYCMRCHCAICANWVCGPPADDEDGYSCCGSTGPTDWGCRYDHSGVRQGERIVGR